MCFAHWFTVFIREPIMEMFNLKGVFALGQELRYVQLYEDLNKTNSSYIDKLDIRRFELANNLNGYLNEAYSNFNNATVLEKLYRANSKLIEELVFLYKFDAIIEYVLVFTKDPIVKAKVKLIGSR